MKVAIIYAPKEKRETHIIERFICSLCSEAEVSKKLASAAEEELRRQRCHELLDRLDSPDLVARAYRLVQYLYIHGDKKAKRAAVP